MNSSRTNKSRLILEHWNCFSRYNCAIPKSKGNKFWYPWLKSAQCIT